MSQWSRCVVVMAMVCVLWVPPSVHGACGDVDQQGGLNVLDLILLVHAIVNETVDELQCAGNLESDCPVGAIIGVDAAGKWACGSAGELGVVGAQGPPVICPKMARIPRSVI